MIDVGITVQYVSSEDCYVTRIDGEFAADNEDIGKACKQALEFAEARHEHSIKVLTPDE